MTDPAIPAWALALQQLENRTITGGVAAADGDTVSSITLLLDDGSEAMAATCGTGCCATPASWVRKSPSNGRGRPMFVKATPMAE